MPSAFRVVDIFAGPGGLSEGFSSLNVDDRPVFDVVLSIEKDPVACRTIELRKMYRMWNEPPEQYHDFVAGSISLEDLHAAYPRLFDKARSATWCAELGVEEEHEVSRRIRSALGESREPWVLIGGPPCQAYSLVGRSRMKGSKHFERDKRHFLYQEYLRIVARHRPAVFVMENVKGILSSTVRGERIFSRILGDLQRPGAAVGQSSNSDEYALYGLSADGEPELFESAERASDFLVRAERHGIPQTRHRVFIVGVHADFDVKPERLTAGTKLRTVGETIGDLPSIRSRLSEGKDSTEGWLSALRGVEQYGWMKCGRDSKFYKVAQHVRAALAAAEKQVPSPGARQLSYRRQPRVAAEWFRAGAVAISQHDARAHMRTDLHRYVFAASFAAVHPEHVSPKLRDFPRSLHPKHANVREAIDGDMFGDRFRVQVESKPSSTITSHMSKDGHYFIHYDPAQCRSLTVREAARLQTFPDSYFFVGNRTEQYVQVGNAVPPLLARDVADIVQRLLLRIRKHERG